MNIVKEPFMPPSIERASTSGLDAAAVLAGAPVALVVVDLDGRLRHVNSEAERLFGLPSTDAASTPVTELIGPPPGEDRPIDVQRLEAAGTTTHPLLGPGAEGIGKRRDGTTFPIHFTARRCADAGVLVVLVRDATAYQHEAAAQRATDERVRRLLETARVIPWEADVATTLFTYVGPQAVEIFGYPLEEWYARDFWPSHIHPDDREYAVNLCATATTREKHYEFEYRMIAADGRIVWIHDIVVVARWRGVPQLISGYMLDVTERKRGEEERARLLEETRRALQLRDEFLSLAAHELRTPLTPAILRMQTLRRLLEREHARKDLIQGVDYASEQLGKLSALAEDLLDVSQITLGRLALRREPVDLSQIARAVVATFGEALDAAGCRTTIEALGPVEGSWDGARVEQMVASLLSNAMKFGAGAPIEVRVSRDARVAKLSVRDHGIGLASEDQERIFERFARAVPLTRYPGLGVGLYVAHEIARVHGGSIRVESAPGQGATFTIELPLEGGR
jgi:PAS domain S-box-containing protein